MGAFVVALARFSSPFDAGPSGGAGASAGPPGPALAEVVPAAAFASHSSAAAPSSDAAGAAFAPLAPSAADPPASFEPGITRPPAAEPDIVEPPATAAPPAPRILPLGDVRPPRRIRAAAAMVYHPAADEVLWARNGLDRRPIASITKVMTALLLQEYQRDLALDVVLSRRDLRSASTTHLRRQERVELDDLLHLALVASDNAAARAIARASPWGTRGFVAQMNRKAEELGLGSTRFADPSGLDERNVSSAYDVARLITQAVDDPQLARILAKPTHRFRTGRRRVSVRNTNRLVREGPVVSGGKTGYISEAGYCLAAIVETPGGPPLAVVVLGARSNAARFAEVRRLADWARNQGRSVLAAAGRDAD